MAFNMHFNIGNYQHQDRNKEININKLPRIKKSNKADWESLSLRRERKHIYQELCGHKQPYHQSNKVNHKYECLNYRHHIMKSMRDPNEDNDIVHDPDDDLKYWAKEWHSSTKQQQLYILSQLITWTKPVKSNGNCNGNRFPKSHQIHIWDLNGFGRYRVCLQFLGYLLECGLTKLRGMLERLWESRSSKRVIPIWSLDEDEKNDMDNNDEQQWIQRFDRFVCDNYRLTKSHYHHIDSKRVYFELKNGEQLTWRKIWWSFIKVDQPLAWNYREAMARYHQWIMTDGRESTRPEIPDEAYSKPTIDWAIRVIKKTFNVGMKRVGKDICPVHAVLDAKIKSLQLDSSSDHTAEITRIQHLIQRHEMRADNIYDAVHHSKSNCSLQTYLQNDWSLQINIPPLTHCQRAIHIEMDYDHSRPELDMKPQDFHYKSKVTTTGLSIIHKPAGRFSFLWSEMCGDKSVDGIITCLNLMIKKYSFGAGYLILSTDGAATQINQDLYKYLHWISCSYNPNRLFLGIYWILYANGHNYNEADGIGHQIDRIMNKNRNYFKTVDRIKTINDSTNNMNCSAMELKELQSNPTQFENIYKPLNQWKDQYGMKMRIKYDKPAVVSFGHSEMWDPTTEQYRYLRHDSIFIRQSMDFQVKPRIIKIMKNVNWNTFNTSNVIFGRSDAPKVKKSKVDDTLNLINKFCAENKEELIRYYTNCETDESLDTNSMNTGQQTFDYYSAMIQTNVTFERILQTGNVEELPTYPRRQNRNRGIIRRVNPSNVINNHNSRQRLCIHQGSLLDIDKLLISKGRKGYTLEQLRNECDLHDINKSGSKEDVAKRLNTHYTARHPTVDRVSSS